MAIPSHNNFTPGQVHRPTNWEVADNTARDALVVVAADVGKFCKVTGTGLIFELIDDSPMTWRNIADGGAPGAHTHTLSEITDAGSAAAADTGDFATAAQGALADTALQPADVGTAAAENVEAFEPAMTAASQGEMEAGTEAALRSMSPLRVAQAIAALGGAGPGGGGVGDTLYLFNNFH